MLNKKRIRHILTMLLMLVLSACLKNNTNRNIKPYFPLEVGSTWVYEITDSSKYSPYARLSQVTVKITKDTMIDQYPARIIEQTYSNGGILRKIWYEKEEYLIERFKNAASEHILYKRPMTIGDTLSDRIITTYIDEFVVPFGSFPAFEISQGDEIVKNGINSGYYEQDLYSPGIGRVAYTVIQNFYGFHISTWKLTDYYID